VAKCQCHGKKKRWNHHWSSVHDQMNIVTAPLCIYKEVFEGGKAYKQVATWHFVWKGVESNWVKWWCTWTRRTNGITNTHPFMIKWTCRQLACTLMKMYLRLGKWKNKLLSCCIASESVEIVRSDDGTDGKEPGNHHCLSIHDQMNMERDGMQGHWWIWDRGQECRETKSPMTNHMKSCWNGTYDESDCW
jgi:hypothetical protein